MKGLLTLLAGLVAFTTAQADPQIYYYHLDQLGTPQALTDANQAVVWRADVEPFGLATVTLQNGINNPIRFPGQYYDAETGLNYNYFRDYSPSTGRYIESDPIGLAGGLNTYAYVGGNPLARNDPTGLFDGSSAAARALLKALPAAETAAAADGPSPIGDVVAIVILGGAVASAMSGDTPDAAPGSSDSSPTAGKKCPPGGKDPCKGLRDQLADHERKLREYIQDPYLRDNKEYLRGNPQSLHRQIIAGRIAKLQRQIANFKKLLEECERLNGMQ